MRRVYIASEGLGGETIEFSVDQVVPDEVPGEWLAYLRFPRFGQSELRTIKIRGFSWRDLGIQVNFHVNLYITDYERSSGATLTEVRRLRRALKKPTPVDPEGF